MSRWTFSLARRCIHDFNALSPTQQDRLLDELNGRFPPERYRLHKRLCEQAQRNMSAARERLSRSAIAWPPLIRCEEMHGTAADCAGCAIVFMAGGEGERLRLSLLEQGVPPGNLVDFTKATHPLPGLFERYGALHVNLAVVARLCRSAGITVPVIVTAGPEHSATARIIPKVLKTYGNFGLPQVRIVRQSERLHLTMDGTIAWTLVDGHPVPVTNPDETGGPLMQLKSPLPGESISALEWLAGLGCGKIIVLQATALYDPSLICAMAAAGKCHDGVGVGVLRPSFPSSDPFGTFAIVKNRRRRTLAIVEKEARTPSLSALKDPTGRWYLPYNTGFYVFECGLLIENDLPDYCTPPKEVLPGLPRAPKAGYAATDILPLAARPAVLVVDGSDFAVIKDARDLAVLSALGKRLKLDSACAEVDRTLSRNVD